MRSLNQDPVENLFCLIRYGITNINPSCHQFIAALKTSVLNNFVLPINNGNCENNDCQLLNNLCTFLTTGHSDNNNNVDCSSEESDILLALKDIIITNNEDELLTENCQALAYVAGYILKKITISKNCETYQCSLFSESTEKHILFSFKEHDDIIQLI